MSATPSRHPSSNRLTQIEQWEQALTLLYANFQDYSREAIDHFDSEAVHQARTNSRRLMTLLSVLDPGDGTGLHAAFRQAQKALGKVRDADVLVKELRARRRRAKRSGRAKTAKLLKAVAGHEKIVRRKRRHKLGKKLSAIIGGELDSRWNAFLKEDLPGLAAKCDVNVLLRELEVAFEQQKKTCKALFKQEDATAKERLDALHRLRIAAKKIRYTAGAASFALDRKFQSYEAIYKDIADKLGAINDKRVWLERLDEPLRVELDLPRKTWDRFTGELRGELAEALEDNGIVPIPSGKLPVSP